MTTTSATTTSKIEFVGVTDERNTCDKCGKTHLKRMVVLKIDGEFAFYGTDCAAKALRGAGVKADKKSLDIIYDIVTYAFAAVKARGLEEAAGKLWNRFGVSTEIKGDTLIVYTCNGKVEVK